MPFKHLVFPSAGSLSVAVIAAFIFILEIWFSTKRAELRWWRWAAAISFSTIIYAVGILLEYNAPEGPINRFGGLLEWTAVIFLVHALYGFVFSRLNIPSRRYHLVAGGLHVLILILLWSTNIFVSDHFVARRFLTLGEPFVEADLGPLGPIFVLYALGASINAIRLWIVKGKEMEARSRAYVWGASFWILLGAHDAALAVGFPSVQYVMEYGFLGFSAALFYTMFSDYLRTSDALGQSNVILRKAMEMRKRLEDALRESEQQHRNLIENINDVIYATDLEGNVTYISPVVKSVMGYTPSEIVGRHFSEFIHNEDLAFVMKRFEETLSGHLKPWEYRLLSKSGEYRWVRSSSRPIIDDDRVTGLQGMFIDITEHKRAERALRESEERLKSAQSIAKIGNWSWDIASGKTEWSYQVYKIFKAPRKKPSYEFVKSFVHPDDLNLWQNSVQQAVEKQKPFTFDYRAIRSDGETIWVHNETKTVFNEQGEFSGYQGTVQDITERKQADEATRAREVRFGELFNNMSSGVGVYEARDDGNDFIIKDYNRAGEVISKVNRENIVGRSVLEVFPGIKKFGLFEVFQRAWKTGEPEYHPVSLYQDDYLSHWAENYVYKLPSGEIVAVFDDVTERKKAEEALQEKSLQAQRLADELELIIDGIPGLVFFKDTENRFIRVNKFVADAHQMTKKQLEGASAFELYPREIAQAYFEDDLEVIRSRKPKLNIDETWETEYGTRWLNTSKIPYLDENGEVTGVIGLSLDITERKKAEQALRESEEQYRNLIESLQEGIWVIDKDAKTVFVNYPMAEMLGYTEEEMVGIDLFEFMDEKAADTAKENLERREAGITEQHDFEFLQKDGSRVNVILVTRPLIDNDGNYKGAIAGVINITERMQAEEALRESEEKYRSLVESTEDSIYLVDRNRMYLFINKEHLSRFGMKANEVIGRRYDDFHSKEETKEFKVRVNVVIKTRKSNRYVYESERVGGHYLQTLSPVKDMEGNIAAVTVVSKDITELIQAEKDLKQANEKLLREHKQRKILSKRLIDLLEKDRRQIAMELHDHIGQILASLKMDIEMIYRKLKPEHKELGARITAAQERTIQAIKDVKNISRGLRPAMIDTLGVVSSLRGLFNEIQRQTDIEIHFFSRNVPKRFAPEKELAIYRIAQEAMTNILKHARAKNVFVNLVKKDEELSLSVEDDGIGFGQYMVMKTTEEELPLGLLIMRERAEQLDGEFTLESQAGKGTHVLVEIPL